MSWKIMSETKYDGMIRKDKWHFPKFDDFQNAMEKSKIECPDLTKMNELIVTLGLTLTTFSKVPSFFNKDRYVSERYSQSLFFTCFINLLRSSFDTVYLCGCGLYKNAYLNIRYALESIIQSLYLDSKHPNTDFPTKIEILKEVQDLPEYRGVQLVKKLDIVHKKEIEEEYRKLSKKIHFTYRQLVVTSYTIMEHSFGPTHVDCNDVSNIYNSMRMLYDIFFLLFLTYFTEIKKPLVENREFVETVKTHNLILLSKVLS